MKDKEKLKKFIDLVIETGGLEGNEWFLEELKLRLSLEDSNPIKEFAQVDSDSPLPLIANNVDDIRNYLRIDVLPVIDYSLIEDDRIRNELITDCLEMGRYRLGKINNQIEFDPFCRFAHLQAEQLVNYGFKKKFGSNLESAVQFLKDNTSYDPSREPKSLIHIPYTNKLYGLRFAVSIDQEDFDNLLFLNDLRNELSHRGSNAKTNNQAALDRFLEKGFGHKKVKWSDLSNQDKKIYNRGLGSYKRQKQDFESFYHTLNVLRDKVIKFINADGNRASQNLGSINPDLQNLKDNLEQ